MSAFMIPERCAARAILWLRNAGTAKPVSSANVKRTKPARTNDLSAFALSIAIS
jgi:hypothetical protein